MDFIKIFKMQKALDTAILKEHGITEEVRDKKILALIVEIGEFANEIKPFKFWKKDKNIDRDKVVEEFVDGIHFLSSLSNDIEMYPTVEATVISEDQTIQMLKIYQAVSNLEYEFDIHNLYTTFSLYMGMARLVGITDKEIEEFYINKNKVNYERIANNY